MHLSLDYIDYICQVTFPTDPATITLGPIPGCCLVEMGSFVYGWR